MESHTLPFSPQPAQKAKSQWYQSLKFRLTLVILSLFVLLASSAIYTLWLYGKPLLEEENYKLNNQIGNNIVASLGQQILQTEVIAADIAKLGQIFSSDSKALHRIIPNLLNYEGLRDVIAGGGIWPEPYTFDSTAERKSYFWGRDESGKLIFYDDYNDPASPGYHHEEWYVPAKYLNGANAYWSKSYIDPYSQQPMVTCTIPMYKNGQFMGVATVDLMLEGLTDLLRHKTASQRGYAFITDRNNKFIAFPDPDMVKTRRNNNGDTSQTISQNTSQNPSQTTASNSTNSESTQSIEGQTFADALNAEELGNIWTSFTPIANALESYDLNRRKHSAHNTTDTSALAAALVQESYQIKSKEASTIAYYLSAMATDFPLSNEFRLSIPTDLFLKEPATVSIYTMPETHWKIVTVFPLQETTYSALEFTKNITLFILASIIIFVVIAFLMLRETLFKRLTNMSTSLEQAFQTEDLSLRLDDRRQDEIGILAHWFNERTMQLEDALNSVKSSHYRLEEENDKQKEMTRLLRDSLATQHAILDSANLGIITTNASGLIRSSSAGTLKLLGYKQEELAGLFFPGPLIDDHQMEARALELSELYQHNIKPDIETFTYSPLQGKNEEKEWHCTRKDGRQLESSISVSCIRDDNRKMVGFLFVISDITQRKIAESKILKAQREAEKSNTAKSRFLASMSHELRTPMNSIIGFTTRLEKTLEGKINERQMDALHSIGRSSSHLLSLINDLLDISKIEAGKLRISPTEFDLKTLISELFEETHTLIGSPNIAYNYELPSSAKIVLTADRTQIKQIIYNLVSNAFKATETGSVLLKVDELDNDIVITVKDTGSGITPESMKKLFQKFSQFDTYVDEKASTGLGLYLTANLIKLHNGHISVDSAPGMGTTFIVTIPKKFKPINDAMEIDLV